MSDVSEHPFPPEAFHTLELEPSELAADSMLWRVTSVEHQNSPLYFGEGGDYRFDAPAGEFGVCYLAFEYHGAFLETFARVPRTFDLIVTEEELRKKVILGTTVNSGLSLFDLSGPNLARIAADNRLASGSTYACSQAWSLAIHDHPQRFDGIVYRSRHDPEQQCVALFSRARDDVRVVFAQNLNGRRFRESLGKILTRYQIGLG